MDNSKEYVEMCERAVEIQEYFETPFDILGGPHGETWLPRQDQLQEMFISPVLNYKKNPWLLFEIMGQFVQTEYAGLFGSGEQFWLAFVMKEKYKKAWDGSEWGAKGVPDEKTAELSK